MVKTSAAVVRRAKNLDPPSIAQFPGLYRYLVEHSLRVTPEQADLNRQVEGLDKASMAGSQDGAQFFQFLLETMGAKKAIEIGTFRGSTTLAMALSLPDDGKVVTLDVDEDFVQIGRAAWEKAGVAHKIDLRIGLATDSLDAMLAAGEAGTYDFAFIDADKVNYDAYYERCLELLRVGGVVAVDNVLYFGQVLDAKFLERDESTKAIHALNAKLHADARVTVSMLPIADGVYLCRKRSISSNL